MCVCVLFDDIFRGSAIARIVGSTVRQHSEQFDRAVRMYVFGRMVDSKKLSEIINTTHENVKYLPGRTIPDNVVRVEMYLIVNKYKSSFSCCTIIYFIDTFVNLYSRARI
jgi:glycerol-3-phosphate dehydrogenase